VFAGEVLAVREDIQYRRVRDICRAPEFVH
jgi:hypothetical protein